MDASELTEGRRVVYYRTQGGGRNPTRIPATVVERSKRGVRVWIDAELREGTRRILVAAENLEAPRGG